MNKKINTAAKPKKRGRVMWAFLYIAVFLVALCIGAASKMAQPSWAKDYTVDWNDSVGTVHKDVSYGEAKSNKFDLYVPADNSKENYGLVAYLHAGGFTTGDKADDREMLEWLCSKGYVAAGINYTSSIFSYVVNRFPQEMHSRLRRMLVPSSVGRESTTLLSVPRQYRHFIPPTSM